MIYLAVSALLTGLAVWAAGIIGFVGLVAPHVVRILFGAGHRRLIPLTALTGGLFLLWGRRAVPGGAARQRAAGGHPDLHAGGAGLFVSDGPQPVWIWRERLMKLEIRELKAAPGGKEILHGIDLAAHKGQFVGIIGPNGSGKSTLLKCVYRTLRPTGGAVLLDGSPQESCSPRQWAQKLAVVAQHNACAFDLTVEEMVRMGRAPHKRALERDTPQDRQTTARALAAVGMAGFETRSFSSLSGGEQQRVILARALAQQTPCLILDEPTNHLDIQYQLGMMDLVRGLGKNGAGRPARSEHRGGLLRLAVRPPGRPPGWAAARPRALLTPAFIRRVYQVEARVLEIDGQLTVLYRTKHTQ